MVVHKNVRSTVEKPSMYYDDDHVYIVNGQKAVSENVGEDNEFIGFEVEEEIEYGKDEYIKTMAEKNSTIETQLTNTQLALAELYEGMVV